MFCGAVRVSVRVRSSSVRARVRARVSTALEGHHTDISNQEAL